MALLNGYVRAGGLARRANLLLGALLAASIAGCMVLQSLGIMEPPLAFSHALHAEEGLGCTDCHAGAQDSDEPGLPAAAQCALCHEAGDAEKPPERRVATLFDGREFRGADVTHLSDELKFAHGEHVGLGLECNACHRGIEASTAVDSSVAVTMADCRRCHAGAGVADTCETCHTQIRTDQRPPNHEHAWVQLHGSSVRGGLPGAANDCAMCHTESSCATCHEVESPPNHKGAWRLKAHGVAAGMDRQGCAVCHRSDFCERCHEETPPQSHKGAWGGPLDQHCLTCHFPLKTESCFVCHKAAPSHLEATPKPDNHSPAMNCLQCHGISQPLPHVDKGDNCNACHL